MDGPPDPSEIQGLASARTQVLARIASACSRVGRDPASVRLIAVSKTVPADRLRSAVAAGLDVFGENRVQEGEAKCPEVPGATWELIGPLQSNKARRALETFERIQTVDSLALAERLDRLAGEARPGGGRYPVLIQVNVDDDPAKAGFAVDDLAVALPLVLALPNLRVDGLMTVGRFSADIGEQRSTFQALRGLGASLVDRHPELGPELSMGMSDDFEVAIEEGATIVRVGRALFGERPHAHDGGAEHTH